MTRESTEIIYKKIQKQKMKIMFADLLIRIMQEGVVDPKGINIMFDEEYLKRF